MAKDIERIGGNVEKLLPQIGAKVLADDLDNVLLANFGITSWGAGT